MNHFLRIHDERVFQDRKQQRRVLHIHELDHIVLQAGNAQILQQFQQECAEIPRGIQRSNAIVQRVDERFARSAERRKQSDVALQHAGF